MWTTSEQQARDKLHAQISHMVSCQDSYSQNIQYCSLEGSGLQLSDLNYVFVANDTIDGQDWDCSAPDNLIILQPNLRRLK